MFWTLELASYLEDAPWPATKDELIDYSIRSGAPIEVVENLQELEDEGEVYESIEDIWPDYPSQEDFLFNEDEYWPHPEKFCEPLKWVAFLLPIAKEEKFASFTQLFRRMSLFHTISQSPTRTTAGSGVKGFDAFIDYAEKMSPLGNASADDCANYCVTLFSDLSRYVTMQNLFHDGGFSFTGVSEAIIKGMENDVE